MWLERLVVLVMFVAGTVPIYSQQTTQAAPPPKAVEWPASFEGRSLMPLPLEQADRAYPGAVARFSDGHREIVYRRVERATRSLHSSADCLQALGYHIAHKPMRRDSDGVQWGCFAAARGSSELAVCERIYNDQQDSFSDVSSWFWAAALGRSTGPWWAVTVAGPSLHAG